MSKLIFINQRDAKEQNSLHHIFPPSRSLFKIDIKIPVWAQYWILPYPDLYSGVLDCNAKLDFILDQPQLHTRLVPAEWRSGLESWQNGFFFFSTQWWANQQHIFIGKKIQILIIVSTSLIFKPGLHCNDQFKRNGSFEAGQHWYEGKNYFSLLG